MRFGKETIFYFSLEFLQKVFSKSREKFKNGGHKKEAKGKVLSDATTLCHRSMARGDHGLPKVSVRVRHAVSFYALPADTPEMALRPF
jgi:hypothetical protein